MTPNQLIMALVANVTTLNDQDGRLQRYKHIQQSKLNQQKKNVHEFISAQDCSLTECMLCCHFRSVGFAIKDFGWHSWKHTAHLKSLGLSGPLTYTDCEKG